jgi:hypothetical protein
VCSWTLSAIQEAVLDAGLIRSPAHHAVQRINFTNDMPLAYTADSWIAGHFPDPIEPVRYKRGSCTTSMRGKSGLATCVTPSDYHNIKSALFHVKHPSFTDTERGKNLT